MLVERRNTPTCQEYWEGAKTVVCRLPYIGLLIRMIQGGQVMREYQSINNSLTLIDAQQQPITELYELFDQKVNFIQITMKRHDASAPSGQFSKDDEFNAAQIDVPTLERKVKELEQNAKSYGSSVDEMRSVNEIATMRKLLDCFQNWEKEKKDINGQAKTIIDLFNKIVPMQMESWQRQHSMIRKMTRLVGREVDNVKNVKISFMTSTALLVAHMAIVAFSWLAILQIILFLYAINETSVYEKNVKRALEKLNNVQAKLGTTLILETFESKLL